MRPAAVRSVLVLAAVMLGVTGPAAVAVTGPAAVAVTGPAGVAVTGPAGVAVTGPAAVGAPRPVVQTTPREAPPVAIAVQRREITVSVGEAFDLPSVVTNESADPVRGLIAHLDILSTDPQRYVDPEDWCTERTVFLDTLGPGESVGHAWPMRAVDSGPLLVWVTVSQASADGTALSPPVRLTVGEHIDVNAGGVLPLVVGVPLVLVCSSAALAWRRRRQGATRLP
jgi:hypothetical protein